MEKSVKDIDNWLELEVTKQLDKFPEMIVEMAKQDEGTFNAVAESICFKTCFTKLCIKNQLNKLLKL